MQLVTQAVVQTRTDEDKKHFLREGLNMCLRHGLTAVQTNDEGTVQAYKELLAQQEAEMAQAEGGNEVQSVPIRVFLTPNHSELNEEG